MINGSIKTSMISAGIAILAGIALFGVNAAIGAAPGYDPPGPGTSPTFTGVTVNGPVKVDDSLRVGTTGELLDIFSNNILLGGTGLTSHVQIAQGGAALLPEGVYINAQTPALDGVIMMVAPKDITMYTSDLVVSDPFGSGLDVDFQGELTVDKIDVQGNLTANKIGSTYVRTGFLASNAAFANCNSGDFLVGCSGSASGGGYLTKAIPTDGVLTDSCAAYRSVSTPGSITAYAICFDPNGVTD